MSSTMENFVTITHREFAWPYPKPIITKPAQPPMKTGTRLYVSKTEAGECKCDAHEYEHTKDRYQHLSKKEREIYDELISVNREMTSLANAMIDSNCKPTDETMKSVYKTDYERRGLPVVEYRRLAAAIDCPIVSPIETEITRLKDGYRDPTRFRYSAIERPHIDPAKRINLLAVPEAFSLWGEPFSGRTEYMDGISKMGLSNMKNRQQYLEPLPSSRRRFGDCKL